MESGKRWTQAWLLGKLHGSLETPDNKGTSGLPYRAVLKAQMRKCMREKKHFEVCEVILPGAPSFSLTRCPGSGPVCRWEWRAWLKKRKDQNSGWVADEESERWGKQGAAELAPRAQG